MSTDLRDQLQQRLAGAYTLRRELAGGGMSHVFVAEDNTLGRAVVVKVLRPELAEGLSAERFKREIQLAARLQHPHIVPLLVAGELAHGTGRGLLYYSMPFVDGESLRDRLTREGSLPIGDVIRVLRDVMSALAYAHRQRIIHRDVKPENILLAEGHAVVTDFGIAKAIQAARLDGDGDDGTQASTLTQRGTSLGTPAYMAPEQATGDVVDHRADLYALGVVAYEALAGRAPFEGRTAQQLLAAHATEAPEPIDRRRHTVPPTLGALVMRLLEKEPADRPQTGDEVLRTLDAIAADLGGAGGPSVSVVARSPAAGRRRRWRQRAADPLVITLAAVTVSAIGALGWMLLTRSETEGSPGARARFTLDLPPGASLNTDAPGNSMVFSPDGSSIAYVGGPSARIFVRHLDSLTPRLLPGTEFATNPQFSPDGRWIGFLTRTGLKRVPASGGPVTRIVTDWGRFAWAPEGTIIYTKNVGGFLSGLWRVSVEGGESEQITAPDSVLGGIYGSPTVLPDGRTVLFTAAAGDGSLTLAAVRLGDPKVVPLGVAGGGATYLPGGYLVFSRTDGSVAAVRFDAERLRIIGDPVRVLDSVAVKSGGVAQLVVAPNGTMAYVPGIIGTQLVMIDRRGAARVLVSTVQNYANPRVSPDGRRIAISIGYPPYTSDIWIYDISSGTLTRLTTGGTSDGAEWTPDGHRIAWTSVARGREGIWWQSHDASAPPELLVPGGRGPRFSPRGDALLATFQVPNGLEVRMTPLPVDPKQPPRVLFPAAAGDRQYRVSPDGRWVTYVSDETGVLEVYVRPFPGPGGQFQVSVGGGTTPMWGPNGRELVYVSSGCCAVSATIAMTPDLRVVRRDTLFAIRGDVHPVLQSRSAYDIMPDGNHFITARLIANIGRPVVVFGWAEEVKARVTSGEK